MAEGQIASPGQPYGDIFFTQSPYLDAAVNQLRQEGMMRRAQQQQENNLLEGQLQKELGKVRSIDQPDIIQGYQRYKDLKKQLLFDKSLRKDPLKYNQLQQAANLAYSDLMKNSTRSAELKSQAQTLFQDRLKNPDNYVDNFGGLLTQANQTPLSQGGRVRVGDQEIDLFSPEAFLYRGGNFDFGKTLKEAAGVPRVVGSVEEPIGTDGLQSKITPFSYGNSPAQVRDYILGTVAQRGAGRAAAYEWNQLPEGEYNRVLQAYKSLPADRLKRMGLSSIQDLGTVDPNNPAANFANYMAMRHAIDTEPTFGTPTTRTNQGALLDRQLKDRKIMAGIAKGNAEDLARLRNSFKKASDVEKDQWLTTFFDDRIQEAENDASPVFGKSAVKEIKISPALKKGLGNSDFYGIGKDGMIRYFDYQRDKDGNLIKDKNGNAVIDEATEGKMSKKEAKALMGKVLVGTKATNEALDADVNDEDDDVDISEYKKLY